MSKHFVHLHLHSEYSLSDGTVRIDQLVGRARELGMPAVAITDQHNLFALVKFYKAAEQAGIKPIAGADVLIDNPEDPEHPARLTLLCQDRGGYLNLCRLLSQAYLEGQRQGMPFVRREWVTRHAAGMIALSGARDGDIGQALLNRHPNRARSLLQGWVRDFPERFYIELQRTGREQEDVYEGQALQLAAEFDCPVVATNDVRFLKPEDYSAHEARVCIHEGRLLSDQRRQRHYSEAQFLRSPEQMQAVFADLPEALENALEIAQRCNLELEFGQYWLPRFPTPQGESEDAWLRLQAAAGLERLLQHPGVAPGFAATDYQQRLTLELDVIIRMGFAGYFLIVADFIRWAREQGIPVGPGRGSGAGSLVAWALGITGVDPLRYELLFERFLNPERISMPDFDIDFCMDGRDRVIEYVAERYGRGQVSQIITYGTMAAKAVVRDCGRVLGNGYGYVDKIAKLIPMELGITLDKALADEPELMRRYHEEDETRAILDLARSLEGLTRNAGRHAGGVVIAPSDLTDFTPLFCESDGTSPVTQFDKDDIESIGLVKFDFLGLRTLTILDWAMRTVNQARSQRGESPLLLDALPLDDAETFRLLQSRRTSAVFQLESRGMKDLIRKLRPDSFNEIVALVALFRPGPLESGMVDTYIERKHGRTSVSYPDPRLEQILKPTYGVILYQEQVMQIAQVLAGYSLGDADLLRRAMGKKKADEMARQRLVFVEGAVARGLDYDRANWIFDQMETFAGYGFNKSHSVAYALIAYQTAWLKTHYPADFMAAVLSADMDNTDKVAAMVAECRDLGIRIEPPDLNASEHAFTVSGEASIRYGLGAIKGIGAAAVELIVRERSARGPYRDLEDLSQRIDLQRVNRRTLETLIRAGALDSLEATANRAALLHGLEPVVAAAEQAQRDRDSGQVDLFGLAQPQEPPGPSRAREPVSPWPDLMRLAAEKEVLGLYLSGHPVAVHLPDLEHFTTCRLGEIGKHLGGAQGGAQHGNGGPAGNNWQRGVPMQLAGLVCDQRRTNRGMRFISLEDHTGRLEVACSEEDYLLCAEFLGKGQVIVVEGEVSADNFADGFRMKSKRILSLAQAKETRARGVLLTLKDPRPELETALAAMLRPYRDGPARIFIDYSNQRARARLELGEDWSVRPCEELVAALQQHEAISETRLLY